MAVTRDRYRDKCSGQKAEAVQLRGGDGANFFGSCLRDYRGVGTNDARCLAFVRSSVRHLRANDVSPNRNAFATLPVALASGCVAKTRLKHLLIHLTIIR